ncbi:hypothetical protein P8629_09255 [Hydrogenovibrio sp. 3SP14C1]|uniref:hypothetical protein n=1 Tax=Hydrogenovibrio sp. 3SP14C1 TaxID=3038774 RepID=UPI0024173FC0|nr:hypothetical protein [Hydrogenovibrio sp. 3SP14C1]MDG4813190.1 hypothetical protein [Hydrogenovibrio sp. 3SP14C1]
MKIYDEENNVYDAVDAVLETGVAAVGGCTTPAVKYAKRIIECLAPYSDIEACIGYKNVTHNGYLYYVFDVNRFSIVSPELEKIVDRIDENNDPI